MKILLDTNAYTRLASGDKPIRDLLETVDEILFSTVVQGELLAGFALGTRGKQNRATLQDFVDNEVAHIAEVTEDVAERYADIFAHLGSQGTPIPTNDIWIAATALDLGARLVTYDSHFSAVPGLAVLSP